MTKRLYTDPIVEHLQRKQMPVTLENWLMFAFAGDPPEDWHQETDVPPELIDELEAYLEQSSSNLPQMTSPASAAPQEPTEEDMREGALRRLKARLALREPKYKRLTPLEYAEHLSGRPLSEEEKQPSSTYTAKKPRAKPH